MARKQTVDAYEVMESLAMIKREVKKLEGVVQPEEVQDEMPTKAEKAVMLTIAAVLVTLLGGMCYGVYWMSERDNQKSREANHRGAEEDAVKRVTREAHEIAGWLMEYEVVAKKKVTEQGGKKIYGLMLRSKSGWEDGCVVPKEVFDLYKEGDTLKSRFDEARAIYKRTPDNYLETQ